MARRRSVGSKATPRDRVRASSSSGGGGPKGPPSRWRLWGKRILIWGGALALLGTIALGTAVYFAARNLPSYSELRDTKAGQTIVIRARDGSEIVAMGPSYGQWLRYDEIPQVMKDAMVSVEDRRFFRIRGSIRWGWSARCGSRSATTSVPARPRPSPSSSRATSSSTTTARSTARRARRCWRWRSNGNSRRSRSSSSTSTRSISAAGPTGSIPPAAISSAIPRATSISAKRRSSPGWSRRPAAIRRPPTSRPRSAAPMW